MREAIVGCRACPRLVQWCSKVAHEKRRMYRDWTYWGKPVPGFGDPDARIVLVGLAPAAHGANRTGRMFTGDRSGDFLFAALHRAGLANQPTSVSRDDGLSLSNVFIVATVRCAPPDNQPSPEEIVQCQRFLDEELALLRNRRVLVALGAIGWDATLRHFERQGFAVPRPRPKFGHGARAQIEGAPLLLGSFHVSQQNTQTGRLTANMFDALVADAKRAAGVS
ncbi:uracil-DNA glycosylase [Pendulispora albinea]|uniref:Type-5 uracil-DNA glycosylase n=2 Tax=Pendulispora albinea TaxID=2741071 RepID=A0ABZ2MCH0_9BACT